MAKNGSVTIRTSFPPGAKVALHRRVGDGVPSGDPVKTGTVSKGSEVRFTDLEPYAQFYAVAEVDGARKVVQVTAKAPASVQPDLANTRAEHQANLRAQAEAQSKAAAEAVKNDPLAMSPALDGPDPTRQIVEGARGTDNSQRVQLTSADGTQVSRFSSDQAGRKSEAKLEQPQPHPRQEDVPESVPQRSNTLTGEATPKDPDEIVPEIPQSEVSDKTPQRSSTERGSAAIKPEGEVVPSLKQEDVGDVPQRSSTELGEAEPIPQGDPLDVKRFQDSSEAKAEGATAEKPREKNVAGAAKKSGRKSSSRKSAKKSARKAGSSAKSGSSKAARSRAAKKAAATRKRNAAKKSR